MAPLWFRILLIVLMSTFILCQVGMIVCKVIMLILHFNHKHRLTDDDIFMMF